MKLQKKAFTLVELIVVITILAILATVGFVSFSGYLAGTRDTNRIAQLKSMSDALELYRTKKDLPLPDDKVDVIANSNKISYQGYIGKNVLETIEYTESGLDPKDKDYFSYYLTKDKKYFQLMAFLEEPNTDVEALNYNKNEALATDYSERYSKTTGKKLGILTDANNTPVQEIDEIKTAGEIDLGGTNSGTVYSLHIEDGRTYTYTGSILNQKLYTISKPDIYGPPGNCPEGFVPVWGDSTFNQKGFCLSAFEMSYKEGEANLSTTKTDWNIYDYVPGKKIYASQGGYPISYITQGQAIDACKSMGKGYHLITENEWMAMARSVEMEDVNWSGGKVGEGYITNGNSNDSAHGCSIDISAKTGRRRAAPVGFKPNDSCNETRKYTLYNHVNVRDIGGNLREHVNKANTLDGSSYDNSTVNIGTSTSTIQWDNSDLDGSRPMHGPLIAKNSSSNGIGSIESPAGGNTKIFVRGGCAVCGNHDGLYALEYDHDTNFKANNYGFRCAYVK